MSTALAANALASTGRTGAPASWIGRAWSCSIRLVVRDALVITPATQDLQALLADVDRAASRFRDDSELARANRLAGRPVPVSRLLIDLVDAALAAAARTDGLVDPTLGLAMRAIGYDRDIAEVIGDERRDVVAEPLATLPTRDWRAVRLHREAGLLTVPKGTELDLGATAKAWTADRAAQLLADRYGTGVLVELGGDVAIAGDGPDGGWRIRVAEREGGPAQIVALHHGGLTTSTTTVRTWRDAGRTVHHVLDPRTGQPADGPWRTASVHAGSAFDANVASTAAIVLGGRAVGWLTERGYATRLVAGDGSITITPGWPAQALPPELGPAAARHTEDVAAARPTAAVAS